MNTQLNDRTLWYDGTSTFRLDQLHKFVSTYDIKYVDELTAEVEAFNKLVDNDQKIKKKTQCDQLPQVVWNIPQYYQDLDIIDYVSTKHAEIVERYDLDQIESREYRLAQEIYLYLESGLEYFVRAIIYIVETLQSNNQPYGVGRGSSVSSYLLFAIGMHDVDSYAYDLDVAEFIRN